MLQTENLLIDPDMCKRLDRAIYGSTPPPSIATDKAAVYRAELVNAIAKYDGGLADKIKDRGLYYLYCVLDRCRLDEGQHVNERMHANAHTAHEQLKHWK